MEADAARAGRLRAAFDWADTLATESDSALARYGGGMDRLAGLVAPTVGRTQVRGKRKERPLHPMVLPLTHKNPKYRHCAPPETK